MKTLLRALCPLTIAILAGCSAPQRPAATAAPIVPLVSPSGWRTGIVEQSIQEAHERRLIRDLWRAGEDAR